MLDEGVLTCDNSLSPFPLILKTLGWYIVCTHNITPINFMYIDICAIRLPLQITWQVREPQFHFLSTKQKLTLLSN